MIDEPRLVGQIIALERCTSRAGKDSISHPPRGHDDVINAAAGALVAATTHDPSDLGITLYVRQSFSSRERSASPTPSPWRATMKAHFTVFSGSKYP